MPFLGCFFFKLRPLPPRENSRSTLSTDQKLKTFRHLFVDTEKNVRSLSSGKSFLKGFKYEIIVDYD